MSSMQSFPASNIRSFRAMKSSAASTSSAATRTSRHVRFFSNRPFGVKRFQTIRTLGVDVARGLVLLFGIGTKALPSLILVQTKLPPRLPLI
jgi:hypothetical protein